MSGVKTGRARVNSLASALSRMQQVPAPLCALYMRRKTALYASHEFGRLLLGQGMAIILSEKHETELIGRSDGKFVTAPQYLDYACRPSDLAYLCLMDFIASYTRAKLSKDQIKRSRSCEETSNAYASTYLFLEYHPLVKTHGIRKRNTTVIPDIIGTRLPDRDNLDTADQRETYGLMALLLFYPFQLGTDLKQGTGSYWTSFQMFSKSSSMTRQAQEILENLQDYFVSKRRAAREREVLSESRLLYTHEEVKDETHGQRFEDEDDGWADCEMALEMRDQGVSSHLAALNGFQESCSPNMVLIANKIASKQCVKICGSGKLPRNATLCPLVRMEGNSQSFEEEFPHPIENLSAKYEQVSLSYLKNGDKVQNETGGTRIICNHQSDADTTISLLEDALKEMSDEDSTLLKEKSSQKKDNTSLRSHCGHFPSISSVANKYIFKQSAREGIFPRSKGTASEVRGWLFISTIKEDRIWKRGRQFIQDVSWRRRRNRQDQSYRSFASLL